MTQKMRDRSDVGRRPGVNRQGNAEGLGWAGLIKEVASNAWVTKAITREVIDCFLKSIKERALRGEKVNVPQFGTFDAREVKERIVGSLGVQVPEQVVLQFRPSIHARRRQ